MTYKQVLQKQMQNIQKKTFYRYRASKILFITAAFLFFVNFFFVGANFYGHIFEVALPFTYFLFCLSFMALIYFFCRDKFLQNKSFSISIGFMVVLILLLIILLLPVYFPGGIFYFF